jgi:hypothetical protein
MRTLNIYDVDETMATEIFNISSNNKFYVKNYAKLYAQMVTTFETCRAVLDKNIDCFLDNFNNINHAEQSDYSAFCKMNEAMDRRKSLSLFFIYLTKNGVVNPSILVKIIQEILQKISDGLYDEKSKNTMDEFSEHIFNLLDKDTLVYIQSLNNLPTIKINNQNKVLGLDTNHINQSNNVTSIFDFILFVSKCSIKTHKGLTSKVIFKFGDINNVVQCK